MTETRADYVAWLTDAFAGMDGPPTPADVRGFVVSLTDEQRIAFLVQLLSDALRGMRPPRAPGGRTAA